MGKEVTQKILDRYKNITPATVWTALGKKDFNDWLVFADELRKEDQYQYSIEAYNFIDI